ncbi:MAG: ABC transporter ATP-binding protein [Acidobacteriota bacterium]
MLTRYFRLDPRRQQLFSLIPYLQRHRSALVVGTTMVLVTNITAVISPWILRNAIDHLFQEVTRDILLLYASLMIGVSVLEGIFRFLMRRILIGASRDIEYDLRNDIFRHLQTLSPSYYQRHPTGDLMSRATNDLNAVRMVLGPGIMYSMNTLFTAALTIGILVTINFQLAVLTLTPLLAVTFSARYFGKQIHRRFEKIQEQFSILTTLAQENVSGVRVVKAYNQEEPFIERFRQANQEYVNRSLSLVRVWGVFNPLLSFLLGLSAVGLLWYGGRQVIAGSISVGDFVAFMAYLAMLTWPTIALGWVINIFERGSASMGRINQILHTQSEIRDVQTQPIFELKGNIRIKNLTFSYNGTPILKDISVDIPVGQSLAIVGKTGSGKSTFVDLLCRLYRVPRGTIFLDEVDINDIPLETLRKNIGYVPQETFLFSETVEENIAFGRPDTSFKSIEESSKASNIWPDIQGFPKRFQTFVGERGITLSGGQKQRIAISRALLVDPHILILDDALSSVDTHTEELILERLTGERSRRTVILISHRISTVKMADQILVLDQGSVVEQGTHQELLEAKGPYADLHEKQRLKEELGLE